MEKLFRSLERRIDMSDAILKKLETRITTATETKDLVALAKSYAEVEKADTDRYKTNEMVLENKEKLRLEEIKLNADIEDRKAKATLEQTKADVDAIVRRTQLENDKLKIENEYKIQTEKIIATSKDNKMMAGALAGGIIFMYATEKAGILLSRNAGSFMKFARFLKI